MSIDNNSTSGHLPRASALSESAKFDAAEYADDIAALGIHPAQAGEFLQIIWDIMGRFVRLGIDV